MKIAFGNDHAGSILRDVLLSYVEQCGHVVEDCGVVTSAPSGNLYLLLFP